MRILGILAIVLGFLAIMMPGLAGLSVAMMVGWVVLIAGILRMIWAFQAGSFGKGLLAFALGLLTLVCGIVMVGHTLLAAGVLTIVLAAYFLVDGVFELAAAFRIQGPGRGWLMFGGVVSILLGILIWSQFPLSGAWAIGVLFGIKLLMIGSIMVAGGSAARQARPA